MPNACAAPGATAVNRSHNVVFDWQGLGLLAAVALPLAGSTLILLAYHHAAGRAEPDQVQFALYWAGFVGGMLPLVAVACTTRSDVTRMCALAGIGLFGMVPAVVRKADGPLGADDFAHLRQSMETFLHGDVGHVSYLLPITREFPGLHQTVSGFARLSGLPLWQAGLVVIAMAHVLSVVAVYQLVRAFGVSARGASAGAVVYTLNPSWVYFDTGVSYESLALPMLLWCLAATIAASRAAGRPDPRCIAVALLGAAALPMIHHLTTIILCLILSLLSVAGLVHRARCAAARRCDAPPERVWPLLVATFCLLGSIAYWWSEKYEWINSYLSPALIRGWMQLRRLVGSAGRAPESSGQRAPFAGTQNPPYEIVSGFLFPAVVLVLFLASVAVLWHRRRRVGSAPWAFALLGATYFMSMPMVLTKGGGEGAHRSWAFSFIGIAVLCGLACRDAQHRTGDVAGRDQTLRSWASSTPDTRRLLTAGSFGSRFDKPAVRVAAVGVTFCIMAVGSASVGANVSARFPGSANVGDDARSVSREGAAVTAWVAKHAPVDTPVLADRYVSQQLGSVGRMATVQPSATFPIWDLYMIAGPVDPDVLKQVLDARIRYFVVDARMATTRPRLGYWFTGDEPGADGKAPFPQDAIDRFNCLPWLWARYAAGPLTVYEVDADVLRRTTAGACEGPRL